MPFTQLPLGEQGHDAFVGVFQRRPAQVHQQLTLSDGSEATQMARYQRLDPSAEDVPVRDLDWAEPQQPRDPHLILPVESRPCRPHLDLTRKQEASVVETNPGLPLMVTAREEVRREGQCPANDELDRPGISMVVGAHATT
jgi:hypothetical protein